MSSSISSSAQPRGQHLLPSAVSPTTKMVAFLNFVHQELSSSLDYDKTIQRLGKLAVPVLADMFMIDALGDDGQVQVLAIVNQNRQSLKVARQLRKEQPISLEATHGIGKVLRTGIVEFYPALSPAVIKKLYPKSNHFRAAIATKPLSMIIAPVKTRDKIYGTFTFVTNQQSNRKYSAIDLSIAQDFAHSAALSLQNAHLFSETQKVSRRYEHLFRGINEAVVILNNEGLFIDANPSAQKLLGISNQDLRMWKISDFCPDKKNNKPSIFSNLQNHQAWNSELYLKSKRGQIVFVDLRAQKIILPKETIYSLVLHDLTESKQAFETNARLAAIISSSDEAIIGLSLTRLVTSWNKGAEKTYGYRASEVIGKDISFIYPKDRLHELDYFSKTVKDGQSIDHFQTQRIRKDGRLIDISISISPIRDTDGHIIGTSTIARDISERLKIERRKDEFLSVASHELKTPVTSIKAYAQILEKYFISQEESKCLLISKRMNRQIDRLSQLVYDLLDVSKIELGQMKFNYEKVGLYDLLKESVDDMQAFTKHHIKLIGKTFPPVCADAYRVSQVMTNLLTNAIKYSPPTKDIIVSLNKVDDQLQVSVQDFGIGIDSVHFNQIFQRFYRVDGKDSDSYGGLGLGLYISHQIIKRQGGKMWVESTLGKGSTFYFTLQMNKKCEDIKDVS